MICDGDHYRNIDTDKILSLLYEWDSEYCMDATSMIHMKKYYALKYKIYDINNPTHMEVLSGKH